MPSRFHCALVTLTRVTRGTAQPVVAASRRKTVARVARHVVVADSTPVKPVGALTARPRPASCSVRCQAAAAAAATTGSKTMFDKIWENHVVDTR